MLIVKKHHLSFIPHFIFKLVRNVLLTIWCSSIKVAGLLSLSHRPSVYIARFNIAFNITKHIISRASQGHVYKALQISQGWTKWNCIQGRSVWCVHELLKKTFWLNDQNVFKFIYIVNGFKHFRMYWEIDVITIIIFT